MLMVQEAAFVCAFAWILYRSWQIYMKPREELEELLGLDIPPVPEVSLAGITSDSALLYWKPPDIQTASFRLSIRVNGIKVGEFDKNDTSIQISGLRAGNYYNVRVLATNTANFTTQGPLIRLRTIPSPPLGGASANGQGTFADDDEPATVRATSAPFEAVLELPQNKESTAQIPTKRTISGRRNSPATSCAEQSASQNDALGNSDDDESADAIQKLTERLNSLRTETERIDGETVEEEEESKLQLEDLTRERDRLRQEYKEKEEAGAELRRHGNYLDKLNRTAQSRKAAKEKQLQQKKADRQRIKNDIAKWERETVEMDRDTEEMVNEMAMVVGEKDEDVVGIRKRMAEDIAVIKSLEEDIRVKGAQIKALEKEQERYMNKDGEGQEQTRTDRENDQAWEARLQAIQAQLGSVWQTLQQSQLEQQQAEEHLAWWMGRRAKNPELFASIPSLEFANSVHRSRSRRSRQANSRTSTISNPSGNLQNGSNSFNPIPAASPPFAATSQFFNLGNGTTMSRPTERADLSHLDVDLITSSGPISPAASNLLPANLFRDDDIMSQPFSGGINQDSLGLDGNSDPFPGHTVTISDVSAPGPYTPGSANSRPGSLLSSPHESSQNPHGYQYRTDPFVEGDQQSVHSAGAPFGTTSATAVASPLPTSKLANIFTSPFNRQRGKPENQESPLIGTLKQGHSQSFPRNLEQDNIDSNGSRRRRGSYGNWANPMAGLLNRNTSAPGEPGMLTARTGSGRKSRLNVFGPKMDSFGSADFADASSSSRPSSTYSYDQIVGRPSSDSQRFGWPINENVPNRSSPLGARLHWSGGPWSHGPSRRPSIQHGSTSNLSIGSTPLDPDMYPGFSSKQSSEQAPIGTRPQSSQRYNNPGGLNPTAPAFRIFARGDGKRNTRSDKSSGKMAERIKDRDGDKEDAEEIESTHESSPQPRLSRDAQSIRTAASTADSHDSFDRSTSGTPSEALASSGPKETLMQKITRKSSSSKFNVPWAKERGFFSKRTGEPSTPGEMDEDTASETQLGKSVESASSTPQHDKSSRPSLSWPNIRRKSRKGDQALTEEKGSEASYDDET